MNCPLWMSARARCVEDGLSVVPDVKGFATLEALARAAKDSKCPAPHSARRRFTSALTLLLQAPFSWGKRISDGKSITASIAAVRRIPERLLAFTITSVAAAVMRSKAGNGTPMDVTTRPCLM